MNSEKAIEKQKVQGMKLSKQWLFGLALLLAGTYVSWLITPGDYIQVIAAISGLVCVWFNAKENIWNYPIGLINIVTLVITFYKVKLYADFTLNIVFFLLSVYGWYYWLSNRGEEKVRPTIKIAKKELIASISIIVIGTPIWALLFKQLGASLPYPDSFIMVASIIAQWFLSKKVLQNWYFWIAVDLVAIPVYFIKNLPLIAILYIVYLFICVNGLTSWKKEMEGRLK